jgi:pimeloyl-ACP methyl ester carboxylesterase
MSTQPETRYARNGSIHLAYQVLGSGPPDLLVVQSGPNSHVDYMWAEPSLARFLRRLASFSRLIMYDNRGVGLSDPVPGTAVPTVDDQVDDLRAILDETGCQKAILAGHLAGCAPALVFAAAHPERVESLILLGGYARLRVGADYPDGVDQAYTDQLADMVLAHWGTGADLDFTHPGRAADDDFRRWYAQMQRMSASPATAASMARQWFEIDVRSVLPALTMPTLILVSRTIRDLIAGAPIQLQSRGMHELKGVPGSWEVFTVVT